ncbi:hypothetical protein [Lactococcus lactis]|uniref:Parvulin-like peptidyl-prolyl isomerase n=1 Tax=Lactococcus lactis TaxID=1358 RepID=A0AAP8E1M4_9LACT|nr:hypothetical protein [Lactococcus lactis]MDG4970493.1 hypothetical protein [Lactococcus lactis]PFG89196.1 hypothetical protein BW154_06890 [Lactococcus lactis]
MYNQEKIKLYKKILLIFIAVLLVVVSSISGYTLGNISKNSKEKATQNQKVVKKESGLTNKVVDKFLLTYYTKKDLGENDNRIEPLVTDAMYNQIISDEKLPVNQAYKGYVIDQVFDNAEVYINQKDLTALCVVSYKNTQLTKLNSKDGALIDQPNTATVRLTFIKQGGKYLINNIEAATLTTSDTVNMTNSYTSASSSSESSITTSSTK